MTPDFSPAMLKTFLLLRIAHMANVAFPAPRLSQERGARTELRKTSGLTRADFDLACDGRLKKGVLRARIWAALWVDPASFNVLLLDDGNQEVQP